MVVSIAILYAKTPKSFGTIFSISLKEVGIVLIMSPHQLFSLIDSVAFPDSFEHQKPQPTQSFYREDYQ